MENNYPQVVTGSPDPAEFGGKFAASYFNHLAALPYIADSVSGAPIASLQDVAMDAVKKENEYSGDPIECDLLRAVDKDFDNADSFIAHRQSSVTAAPVMRSPIPVHHGLPRVVKQAGNWMQQRPKRAAIVGVTTVALIAAATYGAMRPPEASSSQESAAIAKLPAASASDLKAITFESLLGNDPVKIGSFFMKMQGSQAQLVFARTDKTTGSLPLPGMTYQQNLNFMAEPLRKEKGDYSTIEPISVQNDAQGNPIVAVNRGDIALIANDSFTEGKDATGTNDYFSVTFFSKDPIDTSASAYKNVDKTEANLVNSYAKQGDDSNSLGQVFRLKSTIAAIQTVTGNTCYATESDEDAQQAVQHISSRMDQIVAAAVEAWEKNNNKRVAVTMTGNYPTSYKHVITQTALYDQIVRRNSDLVSATNATSSNRFTVSYSKMTCQADENLSTK